MVAAGQTPAGTRPAAEQKPSASATVPTAKVAVIAFQAAVAQTNEFQRDVADLQKKYDPTRTQLKSLSDQIDALTKQLQTNSATLTDAESASRARTID